MLENELYEPMRVWLEQYLKDKYKGYEIITLDTSQERLDRALKRYDIINDMATGVDIQIDVLGIARKHFFLGFFPDTPLPVLTSVVICHSFFLQSI